MRLASIHGQRALGGPHGRSRHGRSRHGRSIAALSAGGLAMLIAGCGLTSPASAAADGSLGTASNPISVAAVPGIDNATLYLAEHNGFFRKAGLHLKIMRYPSVDKELTALNHGNADIVAGDYGDLFFAQANSTHHPYTIVSDGYDAAASVMEIMTMPNSPITNPGELAGRTIAAPDINLVNAPTDAPRSLAIAAAISVLQSYHVNQTAITWEVMTPRAEVSALVHGKVPAILATEPAIYLAQKSGAIEVTDAYSGPTAGLPLAGYFTTRSWARGHSAAIAAFRSAITQADSAAAMPGPVQSILPGYAHLSRQESALVTLGNYPLSTIAASLQRTADVMNQQGMIRYRINLAAMIAKGAG